MTARIEARNVTVEFRDGFGGTGEIQDAAIAGGDTVLLLDHTKNVFQPTGIATVVPVGARFTTAGITTLRTVTAKNDNKVFNVVVDATAGNFTLTFNGQVTANIAHNASASAVKSALEALSNVDVGDVVVTLNTASDWNVETAGQYAGLATPTLTGQDVDLTGGGDTITVTTTRPGAATWQVTFTPSLDASNLPSDTDVVTWLPQRIEMELDERNFEDSNTQEFIQNRNRGILAGVRKGDEQPGELNMAFAFRFLRTGTNEQITAYDALYQQNGAAGWFSTAADQCEPYAIDVVLINQPSCGATEREVITYPQFRPNNTRPSLEGANVQVTGNYQAERPTIVRETI